MHLAQHRGADVTVCIMSVWEKELTKFSQLKVPVGIKSLSAQDSSAYSQSKFNQSSSLRIFTHSSKFNLWRCDRKWTSVIDDLSAAVLQT